MPVGLSRSSGFASGKSTIDLKRSETLQDQSSLWFKNLNRPLSELTKARQFAAPIFVLTNFWE